MKRDEYLLEHSEKRMNPKLIPGWNERQNDFETNADRQADRDELLKVRPVLDANSMENDDYDNLEQVPVYDYNDQVIGYRSRLGRKKRKV